jgi:hypothetical protein
MSSDPIPRTRRRLLKLHSRNALAAIRAVADEQRLARNNVRFLWVGGAISDAEAIRIMGVIDSRETKPQTENEQC